jgi:hypothetical protein
MHIRDLASDGGFAVASLRGRGVYLFYLPTQGGIAVGIRNAQLVNYDLVTSPIVAPGWYLVTGVWHGAADGRLELFVNGVKQGEGRFPRVLNENDYTSGLAGNGYHRGAFNGELDDVRIYRRALNADEISQLYDGR